MARYFIDFVEETITKQHRMPNERYGDGRGGVLVSYTRCIMHTHILGYLILLRFLYVRNLKYIHSLLLLRQCMRHIFEIPALVLASIWSSSHMHFEYVLPVSLTLCTNITKKLVIRLLLFINDVCAFCYLCANEEFYDCT